MSAEMRAIIDDIVPRLEQTSVRIVVQYNNEEFPLVVIADIVIMLRQPTCLQWQRATVISSLF